MKIYLAAPIFTPEQLEVVERIKATADELQHEVFSPYHNSKEIFRGRKPSECTAAERDQVLSDNINMLDWCEVLLCWVGGMGGFTDPGVVWEMGYAHKADKFQLAYIDEVVDVNRQSMNLMLAGTINAVVRTQDELDDALKIRPLDQLHYISRRYSPSVLGAERDPVV